MAAQVVLYPQSGEVIVGRNVVLVCVARGVPVPSITWVKGSTTLNNDSRVTIQEGELTEIGVTFVRSILEICSTSESDSGQYLCIADNGIGNNTANFVLSIVTEGTNK